MAQTVQDDRCPKCLKPRFRGEQYCTNCGHLWPIPIQIAPTPAPAQMAYSIPSSCIVCGNQAIQKVSGIVAANVSTTNSSGRQVSVGYAPGAGPIVMGGPTSSASVTVTELVKRLAPPQKSRLKREAGPAGCAGCFGIIAAILFFAGLSHITASSGDIVSEHAQGLAMIGGALIAILGTVQQSAFAKGKQPAVDSKNSIVRAENAALEHKDLSRFFIWDRSFYCARCDCVFDAATGARVQSMDAQALWP